MKFTNQGGLYLPDKTLLRGRWQLKVWDDLGVLLDARRGNRRAQPRLLLDVPNGITNVGIHYVLDTSFRGTTQTSTWYALLINASGYTGVAAGDTASSHTGWTELTAYSESVRQTLSFGAAASRSIAATVNFTMNATSTIQGVGVISNNTKGGTTGTLFSTALFPSPPTLVNGNVLTGNYSLTD